MKYSTEENLFEPIYDEPTVSGNDDGLDKIQVICQECGRANGEHEIYCNTWLDSLLATF